MATTIRIKPRSHEVLRHISELTGRSIQEELDRAIEEYRRSVFLDGLAEDYAALRKNRKAWAQFQRENQQWDTTSRDGLEDA